MREIEVCLGMWRGWLVHAIDHFNDKDSDFDNTISCDMKNKLLKYYPLERWRKLQRSDLYEKPQGFRMVKGIFSILIILWILLALGSLIVLFTSNCIAGLVTLVVLVVSAIIISLVYICKAKKGRDRT